MDTNSAAENPNIPVTKPVAFADRVQTIDIIRGVALLGILMMNIPGFGIYWSQYEPIFRGSRMNADYLTLEIVETFFSGTMRGLFSMLFGAGMILFTFNKKEAPTGASVAEYYYRRLLWLVFFGVINAYVLLWRGDILFYYGLLGMVLFPFRKLNPKWLLLLGFVCLGIGMLKTTLSYREQREPRIAYNEAVSAEKAKKKLTDKQKAAKEEWISIEKNRIPDPDWTSRNVGIMHSDYATIFTEMIPQNAGNEAWGTYEGLWDMLTMMFIGMGLYLWGFFSNRLSTAVYALTMITGYVLGVPLSHRMFNGWAEQMTNYGVYLDRFSLTHDVLYDIRRVLLSVAHASLIMLVYRSRIVPWLMTALARVGQMAFTNYLSQSIICTIYFNGYGFDQFNRLRYHQIYYVVIAVWIFQLILSPIWLKYFYFGPFEWLWRSLTYWKLQPMRKRA